MSINKDGKYSIYDVAKYFLSKEKMTNKKLQKITYYAESWHLALFNQKLFDDTEFEAWVHGPVSPELYHEYKDNGWTPINEVDSPNVEFDPETLELLDSVWHTYGDQDGNSLEALTHSEAPWKKARIGLSPNVGTKRKIELMDMHEYYKSIYSGD